MRVLSIDYGQKRTGLAVTDPSQIIANGLCTVATSELERFVVEYVAREGVERIVVGHPRQMNGEDSENMKRILPFVNRLRKRLPEVPVELYDERFTSVLAHRAMLESGIWPKGTSEQGTRRRNIGLHHPPGMDGSQSLTYANI